MSTLFPVYLSATYKLHVELLRCQYPNHFVSAALAMRPRTRPSHPQDGSQLYTTIDGQSGSQKKSRCYTASLHDSFSTMRCVTVLRTQANER